MSPSHTLCLPSAMLALIFQSHAATLGFDIILDYTNPPSASESAAFSAAEATWESVITGYQDTVTSNQVTITVTIEPIDGVNGVLGSAGPTNVKVTPNFIYSNAGNMTFDSADTANLETAGTFDDVILHEMGHVLGIGTLWSSSAVGIPGRQELYVDGSGQYTGAAGVAAYNAEFAQSGAFVPVELAGGPGTANGHWNEVDGGAGLTGIVSMITGQDLRDELMTGWLNAPLFMSNLTIASMQDIGYNTTELLAVPEPSTVAILGLGAALCFRRRRR
ncbi:MAG: PEP-CTERM sorting domain-containing protein [Akkermansiaceae bacterium]